METITLTLNARGRTRRVAVGTQDYLVVPVTMIVPGVLPGSNGPLYYPAEEVVKNAQAWNGMPVVVNHPFLNGQPASARTPEALQGQWIGHVYNAGASAADPVLRGEACLNGAEANRVDARVVADVEAG